MPSPTSAKGPKEKLKSWIPFSNRESHVQAAQASKDVENRKAALACYERALTLAGISPASLETKSNEGAKAGKDFEMLSAEHNALVNGYERVRDVLLRDAMGGREGEKRTSD